MTIKFLQNRLNNRQFLTPPYPHWGSIGKGKMALSKNNTLYPTETSYFNFTLNAGFEDLAPAITSLYGHEPLSLDVLVLPMRSTYDPAKGETPVDCFAPSSMQAWAKAKGNDLPKLMTECDSHTVIRVFDTAEKRHIQNPNTPCGFNHETGQCAKGCKATMRFFIILPDLCRAVQAMGYFTLTVHGKDDITDVMSKFGQMGEGIGDVTWRFSRSPKKITFTDTDGTKKEKTHYPISVSALIQLGGGMSNLLAHLMGGGNGQNTAQLTSGDEIRFDVNFSADDELDDEAPEPKTYTDESVRMVMGYVWDGGHHVKDTDVLRELGFKTWADLRSGWKDKYARYMPRDANGDFAPVNKEMMCRIIADAYLDRVNVAPRL